MPIGDVLLRLRMRAETRDAAREAQGDLDDIERSGVAAMRALGIAGVAALAELGDTLSRLRNEADELRASVVQATGSVGPVQQDLAGRLIRRTTLDEEAVSSAVAVISGQLGGVGRADDDTLGQSLLQFQRTTGVSNLRNVAATGLQYGVERGDFPDFLQLTSAQIRARNLDPQEYLQSLRVQGPTLQQNLGLSLPEALEFVGDVQQQGIRFRSIGSGLRTAGSEALQRGEDPQRVIREAFDQIANEPDEERALSIAEDVFGSDSYTSIVQAVRAGAGFSPDALSLGHLAGAPTLGTAARAASSRSEVAAAARRSLRLEGGLSGVAEGGFGLTGVPILGGYVDTGINELLLAQRPNVTIEGSVITEQDLTDIVERLR